MILSRQAVLDSIFSAIDRLNSDYGTALNKSENQDLMGGGEGLDSLGFVNFQIALEDAFQQRIGSALNLDAEANPQSFSTVGTLADYLMNRFQARSVGV